MTHALLRRVARLESTAAPTLPRLAVLPWGSWPEDEAAWDALQIAPHVRIVLPGRALDDATWEAMAGKQQAQLKA